MPSGSTLRPRIPGCAATCAPRAAATCSSSAIEAVWAAEPRDVSLLHVLFYIHSAGSLELLIDTEGGAQQDRFVGGSQLISLRAGGGAGRRARRARRAGASGSRTATTA